MAVEPDEPEPQPTKVDRVRSAVSSAVPDKSRPVYALAIAAGLGALAPAPAGPLAAALLVIVAGTDRGRR